LEALYPTGRMLINPAKPVDYSFFPMDVSHKLHRLVTPAANSYRN